MGQTEFGSRRQLGEGKERRRHVLPFYLPGAIGPDPRAWGWVGPAGQASAGTRGTEKMRSRQRGASWNSVQTRVNTLLGFLSHPFPASPFRS